MDVCKRLREDKGKDGEVVMMCVEWERKIAIYSQQSKGYGRGRGGVMRRWDGVLNVLYSQRRYGR